MVKQYRNLTLEQVDFFMENGYVVIKQAFSKEKADHFTSAMWIRLGIDPNDQSTWTQERIHMPTHTKEEVSKFAPKAWDAMLDLLGSEDRIDEPSATWGDSFIVNLGSEKDTGNLQTAVNPKDLNNWHVDGDFFVHFLDSPEQALLVIPLYSDIKPSGGGTVIAPDGIDMIAQYLAAHPEGVLPTGLSFTPSTTTYANPKEDPGYWSHLKEIQRCEKFVELTGEIGDVILMHPLMLHSASKNHLRIPRIITNPPVALREPFNFNRENPDDFSLVELKTLKSLGVDRLDYKPTTERRRVVPEREIRQRKMLEEEQRRLASLSAAAAAAPTAMSAPPIAVA